MRPFQSSFAVCYVSEQDKGVNPSHNSKPEGLNRSIDTNFDTDDHYDDPRSFDNDDDDDDADDDDREYDQEPNRADRFTLSSLEDVTDRLLNSDRGKWTREDFQQLKGAMKAWSRQRYIPGTVLPAARHEQLVRRLVEEKLASNPLAWTVRMKKFYDWIILSWSKTPEFGAPQRAEEILDAMQHSFNTGEDKDLKPTLRTWNAVLKGYANTQSAESPREIMRVLSKLDTLHREGKTGLQPNCDSYYYLLKAQASVGGPAAAENVLALIKQMEKLSEEGLPSIKPDTRCHNIYLRALVEIKDHRRISPLDVAKNAEEYLRKMASDPHTTSQPDHWSYNAVLTAWSNSGDVELASRAEALIEEMESSTDGAPSPTKYEYNTLLSCYAWSTLRDKGERALALLRKMKLSSLQNESTAPDTVSYNSVATCLVKSKQPEAPLKVEALLDELNRLYQETGDPSLKPSIRSYSICFEAWAKSEIPEAADKILEWLYRLQDDFEAGRSDIAPGKWAYNAYLEALAKQRQPSIADEAERILKLLEERSEQFGGSALLRPDVLTYTNALHCIALSEAKDSFQRAYAILVKMEDGNGDVRPNEYTYNVLVNCVAKSKLPNKAKIAASLLKRMKDVAVRPSTITYNNALNACAYSSQFYADRKEILDIATVILNEAKRTVGANYITYGTYIRVLRFFVMDHFDRWVLIRSVFRMCCEDGQLTSNIMRQIKPGVSAQEYALLTKEATDEKTGEWLEMYTRNARRLKTQPIQRKNPIRYR
ncbi:PPR: pentatricopeptide repeat domain containing protein [Nitzschia inconspicua]|uniref:PPR: pentatricopeptide repeat domain containing protein n=1 Tax=Nitzschia inconspicua TaxID=303405 RepID=A0A9K3KF90_9STRA|nr:PPR: pentatricopeptide repeat domain containing protein [Nitzschia inconspicua]